MALFNKKSPFEKLLEDYAKLSEEDKTNFKEKITDVEKAEDEREVDKIEEDKADDTEVADEKKEEVAEESEEIGEDIDKAEDEAQEDNVAEETSEEVADEPSETEESVDEVEEESKEEDQEDVLAEYREKFDAFEERLSSMEEQMTQLLSNVEEDKKPADSVGLEKPQSMENADDDEHMNAYSYAMKHARY